MSHALINITRNEILSQIPTPSDALRAMVRGLREWDNNNKCIVAMDTFGDKCTPDMYLARYRSTKVDATKLTNPIVCCGCAATATIFDIFKKDPETTTMREYMSSALIRFENMINGVRTGDIHELGEYYYKNNDKKLLIWYKALEGISTNFYANKLVSRSLPFLDTKDWKEGIGQYERLAYIMTKYQLPSFQYDQHSERPARDEEVHI